MNSILIHFYRHINQFEPTTIVDGIISKFWIVLVEGVGNTTLSSAICPAGSFLVSCACHTLGSRGCKEWYAEDNTCYAVGDTAE